MLSVHGEGNRVKCDSCDSTFITVADKNKHVKYAHQGIRFKCDSCDMSFTMKSSMYQHARSAHQGIRHKCDFCESTYGKKQNLKRHVKSAHPHTLEWEKKKKSMYILSVAKWANSNWFWKLPVANTAFKASRMMPKSWQTSRMMSFNWNFRPGQTFGNCCSHVNIGPWFLLSNSRGPVKIMVQCSHFLQHHEQQFWKVCLLGAGLKIPIGCSPFCWLPALGHLLWCYECCVCPMNFSGQFKLAHFAGPRAVFLTKKKKEKNIYFLTTENSQNPKCDITSQKCILNLTIFFLSLSFQIWTMWFDKKKPHVVARTTNSNWNSNPPVWIWQKKDIW